MDEPHIQHAVSFVKHQNLDLSQVQYALLQEVQQTTRRRHQDIDTLLDPTDLGVHADSAKHHG